MAREASPVAGRRASVPSPFVRPPSSSSAQAPPFGGAGASFHSSQAPAVPVVRSHCTTPPVPMDQVQGVGMQRPEVQGPPGVNPLGFGCGGPVQLRPPGQPSPPLQQQPPRQPDACHTPRMAPAQQAAPVPGLCAPGVPADQNREVRHPEGVSASLQVELAKRPGHQGSQDEARAVWRPSDPFVLRCTFAINQNIDALPLEKRLIGVRDALTVGRNHQIGLFEGLLGPDSRFLTCVSRAHFEVVPCGSGSFQVKNRSNTLLLEQKVVPQGGSDVARPPMNLHMMVPPQANCNPVIFLSFSFESQGTSPFDAAGRAQVRQQDAAPAPPPVSMTKASTGPFLELSGTAVRSTFPAERRRIGVPAIIGRNHQQDFFAEALVDAQYVSREHFRVSVQGEGYTVEALSANPMWRVRNGERVPLSKGVRSLLNADALLFFTGAADGTPDGPGSIGTICWTFQSPAPDLQGRSSVVPHAVAEEPCAHLESNSIVAPALRVLDKTVVQRGQEYRSTPADVVGISVIQAPELVPPASLGRPGDEMSHQMEPSPLPLLGGGVPSPDRSSGRPHQVESCVRVHNADGHVPAGALGEPSSVQESLGHTSGRTFCVTGDISSLAPLSGSAGNGGKWVERDPGRQRPGDLVHGTPFEPLPNVTCDLGLYGASGAMAVQDSSVTCDLGFYGADGLRAAPREPSPVTCDLNPFGANCSPHQVLDVPPAPVSPRQDRGASGRPLCETVDVGAFRQPEVSRPKRPTGALEVPVFGLVLESDGEVTPRTPRTPVLPALDADVDDHFASSGFSYRR